MRRILFLVLFIIAHLGFSQTRFDISSESEFYDARNQANAGDSVVWEAGLYKDVFMVINVKGLVVIADSPGSVIFSGGSKVEIEADEVVLSGFQFVGGDIGSDHVISNWGSDVLITQINIQSYECYKYLIVDEDSRRTTISHSNFENRVTVADQNILSILVDNEPGYHKIQYCSFRNFPGNGNDEGVEPIRIGVSSQGHLDSRTVVEYCYFENCDGDGEIISNKATQNVIRYNTFINNTKAELVLRHGDEAVVYGNFFLDNMGGVRVREGQNHFIYNNYFSGITRRAIFLQNEASDPLDSIHIYFNTIVDSEEVKLNDSGSNPPRNVFLANNIFANPRNSLFNSPTGNEQWLGNIAFGNLGMEATPGLIISDPQLIENNSGYFQIISESPAIDASVSGFPPIPSYEGLEFDDLKLDLMKQSRPEEIGQKDIGASEFPNNSDVQPHATSFNTGPSYTNDPENKFSISTSVVGEGSVVISPEKDLYAFGEIITIRPVPAEGFQFSKWSGDKIGSDNPKSIGIVESLNVVAEFSLIPETPAPLDLKNDDFIEVFPNPTSHRLGLSLPTGFPSQIDARIHDINGKIVMSQNFLVTDQYLQMDISKLSSGIYLLTILNVPSDLFPSGTPVFRIVKD
ncbi:MAG: chondroitinase-B domain-containing protein [Cyclobacteriaceae bacterium]